MYKTLKNVNWPVLEEEILQWWKENNTFQKSVENRIGAESFTFYEGPPSANGLPGIHHVLSRALKDIFCRYKTLQGFKVERKGGWDTHGLPIELQVEKRLGIRKDDIGNTISVADYNRECKKDVMMFKHKWDELTERIGYWVDLDNPYVTYENNYIETLWYLLKQLHEKGLLYEGYTIQPYSPAAGTGLSSHELNQPGTYKPLKDTTVVAQFKQANTEDEYFLAWTTTPWTLPSNTALAVGPKIEYTQVQTVNPYTGIAVKVTLATALLHKYFSPENENSSIENYKTGDKALPWRIVKTIIGTELAGTEYEQLLPYSKPTSGEAFKIVTAAFVSTEDGTGIVHIAPSFGSDDFKTAKDNGIGSLTLVDLRGRFTEEVTDFAGEFVKEQYLSEEEKEIERVKQGRDKYLSVDERIAIKLKTDNKAFKVEKYEHSYPHCWRTDKPILYYPLQSWFIKTTAAKERLIELNKTINWKPKSTGEGRFGNWLENLVDWNLSRSRFWGTPLPIWKSEDGAEIKAIGSLSELHVEIEKANLALGLNQQWNAETMDLHKPYVDDITLVSDSGKTMKRVSDLIDVWFDSGAMPYAQWGWPFTNVETFNQNFPADFIAEGVDQTRGWFFTLHAIAVMLFDSVAYKNVVANGLVLDKDGNKMSKRLGNTVDPFTTVAKYGADAVRWYMVTNTPPWDNLKFDIEGVAEVQRKYFGTLYNTYGFFALYANIDKYEYNKENAIPLQERPEFDQWICSKLHSLILTVKNAMDDYDPTSAGRAIDEFVDRDLSNWYVRLNRKRFWRGDINADKKAAYDTLVECLQTISILSSSLAPFFAEWLYCNLQLGDKKQSVHLANFPVSNNLLIDLNLESRMALAQRITSLVLSLRKKEKLKVRQPLQKIMVPVLTETMKKEVQQVSDIILGEVNVKGIELVDSKNSNLVKKIKPNFKTLGPKLGQDMKKLNEEVLKFTQEQITELEASGQLALDLGNRQFILEIGDVEISTQDMPGWLVANDAELTVALDITLNSELIDEGIAREFINRIQNFRKESDFDVTDKIDVTVQCSDDFKKAIENHSDYIKSEILANSIHFSAEKQTQTSDINEIEISVSLQKSE